MEKCPKCGHWTLKFDMIREIVVCYRPECNYEQPVDVNKYLHEHDVLPKLAKSLELNGYKSLIRVRNQ